MKLQVGERYRTRNGEIVDDLEDIKSGEKYKFISHLLGCTWTVSGMEKIGFESPFDIIEHIPKESKMSETMIDIKSPIIPRPISYGSDCKSQYCIPLSEALRLGEEAQRIKAENEINAGDWVMTGCKFFRVAEIDGVYYKSDRGDSYYNGCCKKITNPSHIQALNEIYEGMK